MRRVRAKELQVGDVIQTFEGAFNTSVVVQVDPANEIVQVVRPHMCSIRTKDGNFIFTTDAEHYPIWFSNEVTLVERRLI